MALPYNSGFVKPRLTPALVGNPDPMGGKMPEGMPGVNPIDPTDPQVGGVGADPGMSGVYHTLGSLRGSGTNPIDPVDPSIGSVGGGDPMYPGTTDPTGLNYGTASVGPDGGFDPYGQTATGNDNPMLTAYMHSGDPAPGSRDALAQTMVGGAKSMMSSPSSMSAPVDSGGIGTMDNPGGYSSGGPYGGINPQISSDPVSADAGGLPGGYSTGGPYGGINPSAPTGTRSTVSSYSMPTPAPAASPEDDFYANMRRVMAQSDQQAAAAQVARDPGGMAAASTPSAVGASPSLPGTGTGTQNVGGFTGAQANPGNPGVTTGSQQAYAGGPTVTTSRVSSDGLPDINTDFAAQAKAGADASYKAQTQYFDEDFAKEKASNDAQLQAQGFSPGTEAYNKQMELMQRGQDSARTQAASVAQQTGFQQAGDTLARALAARAAQMGERNTDADRIYNQSVGIAGLNLGARGQDAGVSQANAGASASMANAASAADASKYGTDANATLALRRLGLDENSQNFSQLMQLLTSSRAGVNVPNFGAATPLDVTGANQIASGNANSAANRTAANNSALYNLGGSLLGSYLRGM